MRFPDHRLLPLLLLLAALAACAPRHAKLSDKDNALLTGNSWEVNRAVMLAGERSNNLDVSLNAGEAELKERPENDEARIILARVQSRLGRAEQALGTLSGLSAKAAASPEGQIELARARITAGKPREALEILGGIATEDRERQREILKLRAVATDLQGDHAAAQELYREVLAGREDAGARYNYGRSLLNSGKYQEAATALIALADNPNYPLARVLAAGALLRAGDKRGARDLLEGYISSAEIDKLLAGGSGK